MIGQVLDSSGLDAILDPSRFANVWLMTAREASTPLYLPSLAVTEVRALRTPAASPEALTEFYELLEHPSILRRDLDPSSAGDVAALLARTQTFDVCAGHVCVVAQGRGWPVITLDPGRLRRIAPDVEVVDRLDPGTAKAGYRGIRTGSRLPRSGRGTLGPRVGHRHSANRRTVDPVPTRALSEVRTTSRRSKGHSSVMPPAKKTSSTDFATVLAREASEARSVAGYRPRCLLQR